MIAIVGGIGCGKSIVSRILRLRGFGVFDCDFEASRIVADAEGLGKEISSVLGMDVYPGGKYDRALVSDIIFSDRDKRKALNRLVHSAVKTALARWAVAKHYNRFVECAIAGESGILSMVESIILVESPLEMRVSRIRVRDGHPIDRILSIMEAQENENRHIGECGKKIWRINNDGFSSVCAQLSVIPTIQ